MEGECNWCGDTNNSMTCCTSSILNKIWWSSWTIFPIYQGVIYLLSLVFPLLLALLAPLWLLLLVFLVGEVFRLGILYYKWYKEDNNINLSWYEFFLAGEWQSFFLLLCQLVIKLGTLLMIICGLVFTLFYLFFYLLPKYISDYIKEYKFECKWQEIVFLILFIIITVGGLLCALISSLLAPTSVIALISAVFGSFFLLIWSSPGRQQDTLTSCKNISLLSTALSCLVISIATMTWLWVLLLILSLVIVLSFWGGGCITMENNNVHYFLLSLAIIFGIFFFANLATPLLAIGALLFLSASLLSSVYIIRNQGEENNPFKYYALPITLIVLAGICATALCFASSLSLPFIIVLSLSLVASLGALSYVIKEAIDYFKEKEKDWTNYLLHIALVVLAVICAIALCFASSLPLIIVLSLTLADLAGILVYSIYKSCCSSKEEQKKLECFSKPLSIILGLLFLASLIVGIAIAVNLACTIPILASLPIISGAGSFLSLEFILCTVGTLLPTVCGILATNRTFYGGTSGICNNKFFYQWVEEPWKRLKKFSME